MSRRGAKLSAFRRCIGLALLTTLVVALYTCPLFAAPATRLVYSRGVGADDCADEAALRRAVAERLGYDPFFPWAKLTLVASVRRASNLYYAHIEFLDAQGLVRGTRDFSGSHDGCGEVISAMALGISIALDTMDPRPPEPEPIAPASPASASPASTAPVSTSPARKVAVSDMRGPSGSQSAPAPAPSRSFFDVGAGALSLLGTLPAPALGATVFGRYRRGSASIAMEMSAGFAGTRHGRMGSGVSAWTAAAGVTPCAHFAALGLCGLVLGSTIQATGLEARSAWFVSLGVRLATEIPLAARWLLRIHADLVAPLAPVTLRVDGADLWTTAPVSGRFGVGAVYRF